MAALRAARLLLVICLLATASNLTLQALQVGLGNNVFEATTVDMFLLGTGVIAIVVLLTLAVVGRVWVTVCIVGVATLVLGLANSKKLELRLEPIFPSDWEMGLHVRFLAQMVGTGYVVLTLTLAVLLVAICFFAARFASRRSARGSAAPPGNDPGSRRSEWLSRIAVVALCCWALAYISHFNSPGNLVHAAYDASGAKWKHASQRWNYTVNGVVGGFLYNLNVPAMKVPRGYSASEMQRISQKYQRVAEDMNTTRDAGALEDTNVVLVLSESFSDPTRLKGVSVAEDPIPYTRELMRSTTSGNMLAQRVGGGTANMEFEALTGQSLAMFQPQMNTPYQMIIPGERTFPSAVGYLEQRGHKAIAVHPYRTYMYKREQVYPILGFDELISNQTIDSPKRLEDGRFISDRSAFDEVLGQIDSVTNPLLVNLVTMQNHYPMADSYADPIEVTGVTGEQRTQAENYARGLKYTDEALREFIGSVEASDEKTIVVFYGDHLPSVWPRTTHRANGKRRMLETPFFVYSNFDGKGADRETLPTTSPIYFMNQVFETAGATVPPYYALLAELQKEVPAMEHRVIINSDNRQVSEEELSPRAKELLRDYRLVQYDLSVGKRYSQTDLFYPSNETVSASGSGD